MSIAPVAQKNGIFHSALEPFVSPKIYQWRRIVSVQYQWHCGVYLYIYIYVFCFQVPSLQGKGGVTKTHLKGYQ